MGEMSIRKNLPVRIVVVPVSIEAMGTTMEYGGFGPKFGRSRSKWDRDLFRAGHFRQNTPCQISTSDPVSKTRVEEVPSELSLSPLPTAAYR